MDNQRVPAFFAQGQGNQPFPVKHSAPEEPRPVRHGHHLFGQRQFRQCLAAAVFGKFLLEVLPEPRNGLGVPFGTEGAEDRLRPLGAEFLDVVPLAGIPPAGKQLEILPVIQIVPPCADVAHQHIGVPRQQHRRLLLRNDGNLRLDALLHAVGLNGGQRRLLVPLRPGHRIVEGHPPPAFAPDDQAACRLCPCVVQGLPPHEFHSGGVFAQGVGTVFVIAPQGGRVPGRDVLECQHNSSLVLSAVGIFLLLCTRIRGLTQLLLPQF